MRMHFARLNFMQLRAIRDDSSCLWQVNSDSRFDGAALIEISVESLSLSASQCELCVLGRQKRSAAPVEVLPDPLQLAVNEFSRHDPQHANIDWGFCSAYVLSPVQVKALSSDLNALCSHKRWSVPRDLRNPTSALVRHWPPSATPALALLKCFYATAAAYGQYVMVARAPRSLNATGAAVNGAKTSVAGTSTTCPYRELSAHADSTPHVPKDFIFNAVTGHSTSDQLDPIVLKGQVSTPGFLAIAPEL